jgi:predicted patatin/cPLA2 family phospholipase
MLLGGPDALKQIGPESAWEIRWMDGVRASASLPGITSGRHIEGAILISSRAPSKD